MLLEQGFASGDIPDNTGATAVLRAAELGRTAMLEARLEAGADPDAAARVRSRGPALELGWHTSRSAA